MGFLRSLLFVSMLAAAVFSFEIRPVMAAKTCSGQDNQENLSQTIFNYKYDLAICLIENGANVSTPFKGGHSLLERAIYDAPFQLVELMIKKGAKPLPKDQPFLSVLVLRFDSLLNNTKLYYRGSKVHFVQPDPKLVKAKVHETVAIMDLILEKKFDRFFSPKHKLNYLDKIISDICMHASEDIVDWRSAIDRLAPHLVTMPHNNRKRTMSTIALKGEETKKPLDTETIHCFGHVLKLVAVDPTK